MMCDRKDLREETVSKLNVCRLKKIRANFFFPLSTIFATNVNPVLPQRHLQWVLAGAALQLNGGVVAAWDSSPFSSSSLPFTALQ